MNYLNIKQKFVVLLIIIGATLTFIYLRGNNNKTDSPSVQNSQESHQVISPNDKPKIVSTKPEPLEEAIISASEVIEITFNRPLENVGEFKVRIDPKIDFKVELSGDRKTARIIAIQPYNLGQTYTLFIGTETKFDGVGRWGEEKIFHFRTIKYRGI